RVEQEIKQTIDNQISSKNKVITFGHNPYIRLAACLLLVCTAAFIIFRMSVSDGTSESLQTVHVTKAHPILSIGAEKSYDLDEEVQDRDRKSTRLNSSHVKISYAVFCL